MLPPDLIANNSSMTRFGEWLTVNKDFDGNGTGQAALRRWDGRVISMGDLNGDTSSDRGNAGRTSSYGWAIDDTGRTGRHRLPRRRRRVLRWWSRRRNRALPRDASRGMRQLNTSNLPKDLPWIRAHAISGNGEVVLGTANFQYMYAWVKEGKAIDLTKRFGANSAYAVGADGHRVAINRMDPVTLKARASHCGITLAD